VELYRCKDCQQTTRFARFNNPAHLLKTRRGRCGEFANAFCLLCRSLFLDAQYVLDFTDHVWCEVWLPASQRFVHCDPCERALDTPLMYEAGWNKKLTHVISFSRYGVCDSLSRYSRRQDTVLVRRDAEVVPECIAQAGITAKDKELEGLFAMKRMSAGAAVSGQQLPWEEDEEGATGGVTKTTCFRYIAASLHGHIPGIAGTAAVAPSAAASQSRVAAALNLLQGRDVSWATVKRRKRLQQRELLALCMETSKQWKLEELQGRISGSMEWKLSRGEAGGGEQDAGSSRAAAADAAASTGAATAAEAAEQCGGSTGVAGGSTARSAQQQHGPPAWLERSMPSEREANLVFSRTHTGTINVGTAPPLQLQMPWTIKTKQKKMLL
jgi:hypothetical protein